MTTGVIGFVGLGQMGQPMALNLLKAGFDIRVFDIREERLAPLVELGACRAFRLGEVAEPGGIVLTMVPENSALLDVALGEDGIMRRLGKGGIHLSCSTVSPEVSEQLATLYAEQGSHYLTATVSGRPDVAAAAGLSIYLSGHPDAKGRVLPLLRVLGKHIYDVGGNVALANAVKLGANFLILAALVAMGTAADFVTRQGGDRELFLRMMAESPLFGGAVYEGYGRMIGQQDYSEAHFPVLMGIKDASLVILAAERISLPMPIARLAYEALLAAQQAGRSLEDWSVLADYVTAHVEK
jgi:3-hydroxyisobutyrate dehydrogenase-like beta-hydroxyacid dehydrogenase